MVPVELDKWDVDPFGGVIKDGFVYGRGTIDDKQGVLGILEALEHSLRGGFTPRRSFYIAFGHDEEGMGSDGAGEIVRHLREVKRVNKLEFVLDEGMMIFEGQTPGIGRDQLVAVVGVTEKGFVTLKVK